jgi:hypothetical protein
MALWLILHYLDAAKKELIFDGDEQNFCVILETFSNILYVFLNIRNTKGRRMFNIVKFSSAFCDSCNII